MNTLSKRAGETLCRPSILKFISHGQRRLWHKFNNDVGTGLVKKKSQYRNENHMYVQLESLQKPRGKTCMVTAAYDSELSTSPYSESNDSDSEILLWSTKRWCVLCRSVMTIQ